MRVPGFKITAAAETGPASGLIPASATPATALCPGPTEAFHSVAACEPLSFGPVFRAPLFNHRQDGARSRAAVSAQDFFEARLKRPTSMNSADVVLRVNSGSRQPRCGAWRRCRQALWRMSEIHCQGNGTRRPRLDGGPKKTPRMAGHFSTFIEVTQLQPPG